MSRSVERIIRKCETCGKQFGILASTLKGLPGRGRYCSASCRGKVVVLQLVKRNKAKEFIDSQRKSMARLKIFQSDERNHPRWKGDGVGYFGVHDWITKHYGQPIGCEWCGLDDPKRKYHWANISHTYRRRRDDFLRMCVPCHRKYDYAAKRTA